MSFLRLLLVPVFLNVMLSRSVASLKQTLVQLESYLEDGGGDYAGAGIRVGVTRGRGGRLELAERSDTIVLSLKGGEAAAAAAEGDRAAGGGVKLNFYFLAEACNGVITVRQFVFHRSSFLLEFCLLCIQACNKLRYAPPVAAAPALTAELQSFVHRVEDILGRARDAASTEEELRAVAEAEEQFRARVVPFVNECRNMLYGGVPGGGLSGEAAELERLGALPTVTTNIQPPPPPTPMPPPEEEEAMQVPAPTSVPEVEKTPGDSIQDVQPGGTPASDAPAAVVTEEGNDQEPEDSTAMQPQPPPDVSPKQEQDSDRKVEE